MRSLDRSGVSERAGVSASSSVVGPGVLVRVGIVPIGAAIAVLRAEWASAVALRLMDRGLRRILGRSRLLLPFVSHEPSLELPPGGAMLIVGGRCLAD
jgi:hypothetical protein